MSGLTDAERESLAVGAGLKYPEDGGLTSYGELILDDLVPAVEAIIAARVSDAVAAFRTEAVDAIERAVLPSHPVRGYCDGTNYAAQIIRDLNT